MHSSNIFLSKQIIFNILFDSSSMNIFSASLRDLVTENILLLFYHSFHVL